MIDSPGLVALCGFSKLANFQQAHHEWIKAALHHDLAVRDVRWSEAVAVGSLVFVEQIRGELGVKALHREVKELDGAYAWREPGEACRPSLCTIDC